MDAEQLREWVITPVLIQLGMYYPEAEKLIIGTIAQESGMGQYIKQINGPALGICQMEPSTHNDIWHNYLHFRQPLIKKLSALFLEGTPNELIWNLKYSVAMCRLQYYRAPEALPRTVEEMAYYWKRYYNTHKGRGTEQEFIDNYKRFNL